MAKYINELGTEIPNVVIAKAKKAGCISANYLYEVDKYGDKNPAANIGCKRASRFGSVQSANLHKVNLGEGWVAFKSPSANKTTLGSGRL